MENDSEVEVEYGSEVEVDRESNVDSKDGKEVGEVARGSKAEVGDRSTAEPLTWIERPSRAALGTLSSDKDGRCRKTDTS